LAQNASDDWSCRAHGGRPVNHRLPRRTPRHRGGAVDRGFAHDFEAAAEIMTDALTERIPIEIEVVRDGTFLDSPRSQQLDVILMHHCHKSAEGVLTDRQKQTLLELVRGGLGVVGIHASYYSFPEWDEYRELYGARFTTHGASEAVLVVRTVDSEHPIMKGLADSFEVMSELYESTPLAPDCHVLARARERGTAKEHPSVRTRRYGQGRVVTILPAHWPDSYRVADFQKLIAASTLWAAGRRDAAGRRK
jgi:type 1 glutamine amidotransferase